MFNNSREPTTFSNHIPKYKKYHPLTKLEIIFLFIFLTLFIKEKHFLFISPLIFLILFLWLKHTEMLHLFLKAMKVSFPFLILLTILHGFFYKEGQIFHIGFINLYSKGLLKSIITFLKILILFIGFLFIGNAISSQEILCLINQGNFNPFLGYIILSVFQFKPIIERKIHKIKEAQLSRGLKIKGNIIIRAKAFLPLVSPLFYSALIETEQRAVSLKLKGFFFKGRKTSIYKLSDSKRQKLIRKFLFLFLLILLLYKILTFLGYA